MTDQEKLAIWAAACADRVLNVFEAESPKELAPRHAIEAARLWTSGTLPAMSARKCAFAAHSAARRPMSEAAVAAARSAGHAAATTHVAGHAVHAASYARKACSACGRDVEIERIWQRDQLPDALKHLV